MNQEQLILRFNKGELLYFRLSMIMIAITLAFLFIGVSAVKAIIAIPRAIVETATYFLYFNIGHFFYGIVRIIYFFSKIKPLHQKVSIKRTIISTIFSPINLIILYTAIFLMALTGCAF